MINRVMCISYQATNKQVNSILGRGSREWGTRESPVLVVPLGTTIRCDPHCPSSTKLNPIQFLVSLLILMCVKKKKNIGLAVKKIGLAVIKKNIGLAVKPGLPGKKTSA